MITLRLRTLILLLALAGMSAWLASRLLTRHFAPEPYFTEGPSAAAADKPYLPATQDEANSIEIYQRVSPAVVNITSTTVDFDFFFNAMPKQGSGSGAIIDKQGHILTNYHVVEGARTLEVTLSDKRKLKAKIIGADPSNDLAVIRVDPGGKPLSVVQLGSSSNLQVGQKVLGHRESFRIGGHVNYRSHQLAAPLHSCRERKANRRCHPDRRRHQSREFRWPAPELSRGIDRHQ